MDKSDIKRKQLLEALGGSEQDGEFSPLVGRLLTPEELQEVAAAGSGTGGGSTYTQDGGTFTQGGGDYSQDSGTYTMSVNGRK